MVNVALCDDNTIVLEHYEKLLQQIADKNHVQIHITKYMSGEQILFQLSEEPNSEDLIYMDILMGEINGVETARTLREVGCQAEIIFLTTSDEYVFESFDTEPLHYIIKDEVSEEKFEKLFLTAADKVEKKDKECYTVSTGTAMTKIPLSNIIYFEVSNRIISVFYNDTKLDFYGKMDDIEKELAGKGFVRSHRSFLISSRFIQKIDRNQAILSNGTSLPISANKLAEVKKAFSRYLIEG